MAPPSRIASSPPPPPQHARARAEPCLDEGIVARLVDGNLEGERLAGVERHLAACEVCLRVVAEVGALRSESRGSASTESEGERSDRPSRPPLVRGAQVGRYVVLEAIGAGGMGRVYAAHDPALNRKVALKLLHRSATAPELEARLLREAQAMARLAHPEVITVHDVGRFGDQLFVAMELVEGGTLRQWTSAGSRTWRETLDVFLAAGRGLARAHAAGIVHRDFKPDNVLVSNDGRVRVTDFGLAMELRDESCAAEPTHGEIDPSAPLTKTGAIAGTPAYMAPEQLDGEPASARSDLYAFCLSLWEALYGARPFGGATLAAQRAEKRSGAIPAASAKAGVPAKLQRILRVGLRPSPADRFASMDALLHALAALDVPARALGRSREALAGSALLVALGAAIFLTRAPVHVAAAAPARAPAPPPECTSNAACVDVHAGAPWVCRRAEGRCAPLASEDCAPYFEPDDLRASDTIWLGALLPTKGASAASLGKPNLDAADLARREIASATSALAGADASLRVPRVALVACDDSENGMRAAKHLVTDVGVPAILGFRSGKEVVDISGSFLVHERVLTMATLTQSPAITRLPQPPGLPRLVWRTTSTFEAEGEALAHVVHDAFEPKAIANANAKSVRIVLLRDDEASSLMPFAEAFYRTLTLNGRSAPANGEDYQEITLPPRGAPFDAQAWGARIAAARPTFVVTLTEGERVAALADAIERARPEGAPRATYLIADDTTAVLDDFIGASAERRHRVFAFTPAAMPTETGRFLMRFDAAHPGEATATLNPGSTYDGFYALAYASFALGTGEASGPALARGLARLVGPGPRVESGPTDLFRGIAALANGTGAGAGIDLSGPSGPLDFAPATGEISIDYAVICPAVGPSGRAAGDVESGLVYAESTRKTSGVLRCP